MDPSTEPMTSPDDVMIQRYPEPLRNLTYTFGDLDAVDVMILAAIILAGSKVVAELVVTNLTDEPGDAFTQTSMERLKHTLFHDMDGLELLEHQTALLRRITALTTRIKQLNINLRADSQEWLDRNP